MVLVCCTDTWQSRILCHPHWLHWMLAADNSGFAGDLKGLRLLSSFPHCPSVWTLMGCFIKSSDLESAKALILHNTNASGLLPASNSSIHLNQFIPNIKLLKRLFWVLYRWGSHLKSGNYPELMASINTSFVNVCHSIIILQIACLGHVL